MEKLDHLSIFVQACFWQGIKSHEVGVFFLRKAAFEGLNSIWKKLKSNEIGCFWVIHTFARFIDEVDLGTKICIFWSNSKLINQRTFQIHTKFMRGQVAFYVVTRVMQQVFLEFQVTYIKLRHVRILIINSRELIQFKWLRLYQNSIEITLLTLLIF